MDYKTILDEEKIKLRSELKWWPNFVYHFTDVHNASQILQSGWIYSRSIMEDKDAAISENASMAVIEATIPENKTYGRLYFRPLTPTQYHNEGYKPVEIRDPKINACCPVPIFICFSAVETLNFSDTKFVEKGLAGRRHNFASGVEEFQKLNFSKIYHEGGYGKEECDIRDYRQSEIVRENGFPVEPLLRVILCRTQAERETLLYLIKQYSLRMYNSYKDKIYYMPQYKVFFNNGIFVKSVKVDNGTLSVMLNDPEQRLKKDEEIVTLGISIELWYKKLDGMVITNSLGSIQVKYGIIRRLEMKLLNEIDFDILKICIRFDASIMYENEICVEHEIF